MQGKFIVIEGLEGAGKKYRHANGGGYIKISWCK